MKEHSCGGICPGRDEQENECQPDCGIYGVWTGSSCKCDHGYMGQCCRKQEDMSAMLEVRILDCSDVGEICWCKKVCW